MDKEHFRIRWGVIDDGTDDARMGWMRDENGDTWGVMTSDGIAPDFYHEED